MDEPTGLSEAKRRIVEALKRRSLTGPELAKRFDVSTEAVRQHLTDLAEHGLVRSSPRPTPGPGRPPVAWSLTELASDLFPDRHADLTVSLIDAVRAALGDEGLDAVVAERAATQLAHYRSVLADSDDPVATLAAIRSDEGYMAEVVAVAGDTDGSAEGGDRLLIEHHCPICEAASSCQRLCQAELELFRSALGPSSVVTREQHLLSGDARCVYRIRPREQG